MSDATNGDAETIYILRFWSDDEERPRIDFQNPSNGTQVPWLLIGEILEGNLSSDQYIPISFVVDDDDTIIWDTFPIPGTNGLISKNAADVLHDSMAECFECLEASVNESPYFLLRSIGSIDCLDRDKSRIIYTDDEHTDINFIEKHEFKMDLVPERSLFRIPQVRTLFATEAVRKVVEDAKLKGFYFVDLEWRAV
jgi:hypothetical protein